jgi:hypothetical protein
MKHKLQRRQLKTVCFQYRRIIRAAGQKDAAGAHKSVRLPLVSTLSLLLQQPGATLEPVQARDAHALCTESKK